MEDNKKVDKGWEYFSIFCVIFLAMFVIVYMLEGHMVKMLGQLLMCISQCLSHYMYHMNGVEWSDRNKRWMFFVRIGLLIGGIWVLFSDL